MEIAVNQARWLHRLPIKGKEKASERPDGDAGPQGFLRKRGALGPRDYVDQIIAPPASCRAAVPGIQTLLWITGTIACGGPVMTQLFLLPLDGEGGPSGPEGVTDIRSFQPLPSDASRHPPSPYPGEGKGKPINLSAPAPV